MTPEFVEVHSLDIGPLSNLSDSILGINGLGGGFSWPLAYIIIRAQVERIWGYNEDQVALVILDYTGFGSQVPVTLGTPTINWIINVIKESEINELLVSLNGSRTAQLLACHQARLSIQRKTVANQTVDPTDLNKVVKMTKKEERNAFSSKIVQGQMKTLLLGNNLVVMTQFLKGDDGPHLSHGLSVVNTYTRVISGSKQVVVVVKNLMATLITITKGIKVAQVVAANVVPPGKVNPDTLEKLAQMQGIQQTKMAVEQRKKLLFQQLDSSDLDKLSDKNQVAAQALLPEYHDIFSLEPGDLGCMDLAKHEIRALSALVKAHGVIQLCWCARKMEVCTFVLTFISSMPEPRKTPIHFPKYRKP